MKYINWEYRQARNRRMTVKCSLSYHFLPSNMLRKLPLDDLPTPEPETPFRPRKPYRFSTLCATVDNPDMKDQYGSSSVPIYQTATFKGMEGRFDYSRSGNPTRSHLRRSPCIFEELKFLFLDHRTPSCKNLFRCTCIHRFIWHGRARCYSPSAETRRRGNCW